MTKKIISTTAAIFIMVPASMLNAETWINDFSTLENVSANVFTLTQNGITFTATATGGDFRLTNASGVSAWTGSWNGTSMATLNNVVSGTNATEGWKDYICTGAKSGTITMEFSGLAASSNYSFVLFTGIPREGAGSWNSLNVVKGTASATLYTSSSASGSSYTLNAQSIAVNAATAFVISGQTNADGVVSFILNNTNNSHSNSLNYIAFSGIAIPEPSMFGLLAGLGAIALVSTRRRRK